MKDKREMKKELKKLKENNEKNKQKKVDKQLKNIQNNTKKITKNNYSSKKSNSSHNKKQLKVNRVETSSKKQAENKKKYQVISLEKKGKTKKKKYLLLILSVIIFVILALIVLNKLNNIREKEREEQLKLETIRKEKELVEEITSHYNEYVKTNKEALLYNEEENIIGKLAMNIEISLESLAIDKDTKYFKIIEFDNAYIKYEDVEPIETLSSYDGRYKKYVPFNENVVTGDITVFYDENDNLVYEFNKSFELPIIVKETGKYGIEFNNRLLYVDSENVINTKNSINSDLPKATSVRVIAYHSFYDKNDATEAWCRNSICHSVEQIEAHSKYISENDYFTLTMKELERYIDGKINIPKNSVVITIDDGLLAERGIEVLSRYKLNATAFLITSYYTPELFVSNEYIEFHSHGHNIHNVGQCPGGQGGGIKCLEKTKLLNDLQTSSELLNGSTVFCYPFYEYNSYAISILKEAGYTMAFAGLLNDGKVHVGTNKYLIPRYTITSDTTVYQLANIIK